MKHSLDWSAYKDSGMGDAYADIPKNGGDYAKAIAVCINSGQCETNNKLLMCPSFKVSGDSHLSTGGRVRLLKEALGSDDWQQALKDPELARAMDLCVSCKGCKRECDNNVDMALIKSEYLAWRARHQRHSVRSRLFAATPLWLHRAPWLRRLIEWRNGSPWLARMMEKCLQISAVMPLPLPSASPYKLPVAAASLSSSVEEAGQAVCDGKPEVVLLVDTFNRYFEPEIAQAAEDVLKAGGYKVTVAAPAAADNEASRPLCCGRTYLAQGMVSRARQEVARLVTALQPHVAAGRVIVGLEASCVLGLRDDALALGLGEPLQAVSQRVFLLEEFLAKEIMAKRLELPLRALPARQTLVHGHCHQKAVGAMKSVRRVLKLIPQHDFEMIDSGCCGMAGTFSLEAEHQATGRQMAERELLPAIHQNAQARIVANGFSCRQQIRACGDKRPQHLALLLREALHREAV